MAGGAWLTTTLVNSFILIAFTIGFSHITYGLGSRNARDMFLILILLLIVTVQYHYLLGIASYVPSTKHYKYFEKLYKIECLNCNKGGKPTKSEKNQRKNLNPCYCSSKVAVCYDAYTNDVITDDCHKYTSYCKTFTGNYIPKYLNHKRDCRGGQGTLCTKDSPCTPCDLDSVVKFGSSRCSTCTSDNRGDCHFIEGIGPYCYVEPGSRAVEPCKKCCSEPELVFNDDVCVY